jgi:hypothetical protein
MEIKESEVRYISKALKQAPSYIPPVSGSSLAEPESVQLEFVAQEGGETL